MLAISCDYLFLFLTSRVGDLLQNAWAFSY